MEVCIMADKVAPGKVFAEEDLQELVNYSLGGGTKKENEETVKEVFPYMTMDLEPTELPAHHVEITQMTAKQLCDFISSNLREVFDDFKGCIFKPDNMGNLQFLLVFEVTPEAVNGKYKAIHKFDKKIDNIVEFTNRRFTMELTEFAKSFFYKYMIPVNVDRNGMPKIKWKECIEEKNIDGTAGTGYTNSATLLVLKNIDVRKIIEDLWTPPQVKASELKYAIDMWKKNNWEGVPGKPKEVYQGKESDDEIAQKVIPNKRYIAQLKFKGFQLKTPDGRYVYSTTPVQMLNTGQTIRASSYDFDKYYVNIEIIDVGQLVHDFPQLRGRGSDDTDYILSLI